MGFFADLGAEKPDRATLRRPGKPQRLGSTARGAGSLWREIFGDTDKETPRHVRPRAGGGYATSASSNNSLSLLLRALRSLAPGGWSDDRWEETRHFVGIVYVAVHRKCEQMAQSTFQVYQKDPRTSTGKRPVPDGHPLVQLLQHPNTDDSFGDLMYMHGLQMDLTGTSLTWMVPNKLSVPYELYPIPTALAIPQPAVNPDFPDGFYRLQPVYPYGPFSTYPTPASAVGAPIPSQWMLRIKYPHPFLRYDGYSPLTGMRLSLDVLESIYRSRWYTMKRSVNPSAVLNMEDMEGGTMLPEPEIERLMAQFENTLESPENHGRLFVSMPGAKLEPWGGKPNEMDYANGWEQETSFGMAGFGITKPAAGMIEDASYASLFATLKQLDLLTLKPQRDRIAAKYTRHVAPFFGDDLIVEITGPRIDDHEVKEKEYRFLTDAKTVRKNEVRVAYGLPPTDEPWGDELAGDPSPSEQQQMEADQRAKQGPPPEDLGLGGDDREEPEETTRSREDPGDLSENALGPRGKRLGLLNGHAKHLNGAAGKSAGRYHINVNVPAQKAPVVNVSVPEQLPPVVNVNVPRPRPTRKSIKYDDLGRPVSVEEG